MSSKKITIVLGIAVVIALSYVAYVDAVSIWRNLQDQKQQIRELNVEQERLDEELEKTIEVKQKSQKSVQKLEQEKRELEIERKRLERELQAKAEAKAEAKAKLARASRDVINTATITQTANASAESGARSGCGDNQYAAYIYGQESGGRVTGNCDTTAKNAGGCWGIGQDCNNVLYAQCGASYACQNTFFNNYAIERYSSWANAYSFHRANGWW